MEVVVLEYDTLMVGRKILSQKKLYLLYMLLPYPEKVFTRIHLMDEIWDIKSDSSTQALICLLIDWVNDLRVTMNLNN